MEHLEEPRSGEQTFDDIYTKSEQLLAVLERRGIVENASVPSKKAREAEKGLRRNMYHKTQVMLKLYQRETDGRVYGRKMAENWQSFRR